MSIYSSWSNEGIAKWHKSKKKESEKKIGEERFSRTLFNEEYERHQSINISEDDMVYPPDCENHLRERHIQKSNNKVKN